MEKQKLGYIGCGLLVVGLFLPIVYMPIVGNVTLMSNGSNLTALALLVLGGISAVLVAKDRQQDLIWPGAASVASLIYLFGRLQYDLSQMKAETSDSLNGHALASVAQASMGAIQVQWGWLVLAAGAGLLVHLAIQARKEVGVALLHCGGPNERALLAASMACFMVAPALDAWASLRPTRVLAGNAVEVAATDAVVGKVAAAPAEHAPTLKWESFNDGSRIAHRQEGDGDEAIVRCWEVEGEQDCVAAYKSSSWANVRRSVNKSIFDVRLLSDAELKAPANGYDCDVSIESGYGFQEHISGPHGQLKEKIESSSFGGPGASWSADFVNQFMKDNGVEAKLFRFDCRAVWRAVSGNSISALGSSEFSHKALGEK